MFSTPILFLIFNRPDTTYQVFEKIKEIRPKQLFIAADGSREEKPGEKEKCEQTRKVIEAIDWECEVNTLFRDQNLGCKMAVSSAIDWFFEHVEEGIILEDDCLPDKSFFFFCQDMLKCYKNDLRVFHISGDNFLYNKLKINYSYYFSKYPHIWGWATWRRAWKSYDVTMKDFALNNEEYQSLATNKIEKQYWLMKFKKTFDGSIDTWDYIWIYTIFRKKGYCITPKVNMVSNIGFGEDATHTFQTDLPFSNLKACPINQIAHPPKISLNQKADQITFNNYYQLTPSFKNGLRNFCYKHMPILYTFIKKVIKRSLIL